MTRGEGVIIFCQILADVICKRSLSLIMFGLGPQINEARTAGGKKPSTPKIQKGYTNGGLCGYTVSSLKAVRCRCIMFVLMLSSVFFTACCLGVVCLGPKPVWSVPRRSETRHF